MDLRFDGKVVLITGASSGIGRAIALGFGASGAKTALNCHRRTEAEDDAARIISGAGGVARVYQADVTDRPAVEAKFGRVHDELGPVDILVNNAGAANKLVSFAEMTDAYWDDIMALTLRSAFLCCRAVLPHMIERGGGAIINVSSVVARHGGGPGELAYTAAKGGLSAFTRGLTREPVQISHSDQYPGARTDRHAIP